MMKHFGTYFAPFWQCELSGVHGKQNFIAMEGNKMLKRLLFFITLVIILVSLNWFKVILAQDLSNLSEEQKKKLQEQYDQGAQLDSLDSFYKSPEIFEKDEKKKSIRRTDQPDSLKYPKPDKYKILNQPDSTKKKLVKELTLFEDLKPFGYELFEGPQLSEETQEIASASDYILGPGDNVIVYLWGRVEKELNLTLDREGKIFIQRVGDIVGWGLTLEQFTGKIKDRLSEAYSDFNITLSLGKIRSLRIFVSGEVKYPGAYTVSSLSSVINALYLAGGPNERGSMRSIRVMRNGKKKAEVDLYDFLLRGDNSDDIKLEAGDVVFIPVAGARVAIRGAINREAIYELNGTETAMDLIEISGNAKPTAHLDRVMLERISKDKEWVVLDLNLNKENPDSIVDVTLQDGDRLTVKGIFEFEGNKVGIYGHVKHPGFYERTDSIRVSNLLQIAELQPYDVFLDRADLFRRYSDWKTEVIAIDLKEVFSGNPEHDLLLKDLDSIHIHSIEDVVWDRWVFIEGSIQYPGRYNLYQNMTVEDLIFLAGSFSREASTHKAEIARLDSLGEVSLIYVGLDDGTSHQVLLQEDDHLYIRQIPEWQFSPSVSVEGEVLYPGEYMLSNREESLYQLLKRAGGFTKNAFPIGIVLERESIGENLERVKIRGLINKSQPVTTDSLGKMVLHNLFEYDPSSLNRIIIDIKKMLATNGKVGDVILEPDDRIYIPSIPPGIPVMGAVGANGTIKFETGLEVKNYIKRAGNFTRRSDRNETKLIRANGEIISGKKALGKQVELGDVVFIPSKIERERHFLRAFSEILSVTTGLLTTVYIVSKL